MGKKDFETFSKSQYALRDYMHYEPQNEYMHKSNIFVNIGGERRFVGLLDVLPRIETNYSFVEILGDVNFEREFYTKYTNEYQEFSIVDGILVIKGEDKEGNSITIEVC